MITFIVEVVELMEAVEMGGGVLVEETTDDVLEATAVGTLAVLVPPFRFRVRSSNPTPTATTTTRTTAAAM